MFEWGPARLVEIRFGPRTGPAPQPPFTLAVYDPDVLVERTLADLRQQVAERCAIPVFVGTAPPAEPG